MRHLTEDVLTPDSHSPVKRKVTRRPIRVTGTAAEEMGSRLVHLLDEAHSCGGGGGVVFPALHRGVDPDLHYRPSNACRTRRGAAGQGGQSRRHRAKEGRI